jgi:hypothetical protein
MLFREIAAVCCENSRKQVSTTYSYVRKIQIPLLLEQVALDDEIRYVCVCVYHLQAASVVKWSEFLATDPEVRVRFPALPDFLRSSWSGTGSTQPREYN